jgi:hypothetical protein
MLHSLYLCASSCQSHIDGDEGVSLFGHPCALSPLFDIPGFPESSVPVTSALQLPRQIKVDRAIRGVLHRHDALKVIVAGPYS